jgi:hypothetical protein
MMMMMVENFQFRKGGLWFVVFSHYFFRIRLRRLSDASFVVVCQFGAPICAVCASFYTVLPLRKLIETYRTRTVPVVCRRCAKDLRS